MNKSKYLIRYISGTDGSPVTQLFTDWLAALERYTELQDKFFEPEMVVMYELKIPVITPLNTPDRIARLENELEELKNKLKQISPEIN